MNDYLQKFEELSAPLGFTEDGRRCVGGDIHEWARPDDQDGSFCDVGCGLGRHDGCCLISRREN